MFSLHTLLARMLFLLNPAVGQQFLDKNEKNVEIFLLKRDFTYNLRIRTCNSDRRMNGWKMMIELTD